MPDPSETPETPWPDWLEGLTPEIKLREILRAVAARHEPLSDEPYKLKVTEAEPLVLRLLDEARQPYAGAGREALRADVALFLNGLGGNGWVKAGTPQRAAEDRLRAFAEGGESAGPLTHFTTATDSRLVQDNLPVCSARHWQLVSAEVRHVDCPDCQVWLGEVAGAVASMSKALENAAATIEQRDARIAELEIQVPESGPSAEHAQNAVMKAALHRLALDEPMTASDDYGAPQSLSAELSARLEHAAGTLETIARLGEPGAPEHAGTRAEVLAMIAADWTIDPSTGRSNSSEAYRAMVREVGRLIHSEFAPLDRSAVESAASLIVSQLAHVHGLAPPGFAAGKAEPAAQLPPRVAWVTAVNRADRARSAVVRAALRCLSADLDAEANPRADSDAACEYAAEQVALAARELAEATSALPDGKPVGWDDMPEGARPGRPLPASLQPVPLLPDGTYVDVQIKGFQHCEGYLTAGSWHGERYGFLHGKDGEFVAAFPPVAGSVHLITAVPEPGSEPEQPDPWAQTMADVRADAAVLKRNWRGDRDKLIALRTWAESSLKPGGQALAEVLAIFERDFRPQEADEEAPFR